MSTSDPSQCHIQNYLNVHYRYDFPLTQATLEERNDPVWTACSCVIIPSVYVWKLSVESICKVRWGNLECGVTWNVGYLGMQHILQPLTPGQCLLGFVEWYLEGTLVHFLPWVASL